MGFGHCWGGGNSEVRVFLLLGMCLPAWGFCSPMGKGMAVFGVGLPYVPLG